MENDIATHTNSFAIVIVTFNPDSETLKYLNTLNTNNATVFIIDNSNHDIDFKNLKQTDNIQITRYGKNLGLAFALNDGIEQAAEQNIHNIFLFDQDTRVDDDFFNNMLAFKENNSDEAYSVYAPDFIDTNSNTHARFSILNRFSWHTVECNQSATQVTTFAITSGSLIDYETYKKVGGFDTRYFIDHIDSEYCVRAAKAGFKVIINCKALLRHSIGDRTVHRFLGLTIKPNHHDASRRYYIARNGMHMTIKHGFRYPSLMTLHIARIGHEVLSVLFYENQKFKKMLAIFIGTLHGVIGKLGQCKNTYIND